MVDSTDAVLIKAAFSAPAVYLDRFQLLVSADATRIAFGKVSFNGKVHYRVAIVLPAKEALALADAIRSSATKLKGKPIPQVSRRLPVSRPISRSGKEVEIMHTEDDATFLKRLMAEVDEQAAANNGIMPPLTTLESSDLMRLVKLYAGIPRTAMRIN